MPIDLYVTLGSAPCAAVQMAARALNVPLNLKNVDLHKGEHLTPEFLKLNPQHFVPTLVDDGFNLCESRAIMTYLANKYGKGSSLYPEDPKARALVDQRLYFDIGTLYEAFASCFFPMAFEGAPEDSAKRAKVEEALKYLDGFLEGQTYVAGPNLTLADLSLVASMSTFEAAEVDFKKYANIKRWLELVKKTAPGCEEIIEKGMESMKGYFKALIK